MVKLALPTPDDAICIATKSFLDKLDMTNLPKLEQLKGALLQATCDEFILHNASADERVPKWKLPADLFPYQVAMVVQALEHVCCISCGGDKSDVDTDLLGVYQESGPNAGLYVTDKKTIRRIIRQYNRRWTDRQIDEVISILRENVPHVPRCQDQDLIAVNNGLFDYKTKKLLPFTPDKVYIAKCRVDYKLAPMNPTIHNDDDGTDWDVESWVSDLSDDPEIVQLFWEMLGAIIRPYVRWDKSAWLYSTSGNNGKGSLCALMRNLCGPGSYASISISDFSKKYKLGDLTRATAIIVDENDVGAYIDKAANLKTIVTSDVFTIEKKFKDPFKYQFYGFMVQCLNEFPRFKDKSDSFYRRQLFIPFEKCFTGMERKYIKSNYLNRSEVLEYVLHKVLHMNYYQLSEPQACKDALAQYKEFNDPVRQFAEEMLPECKWDLLPFAFLYDLYQEWFKRNSPSGSVQGKNTFISDLLDILPSFPEWTCKGRNKQTRSKNRMEKFEPLIFEYNLVNWQDKRYTGGDIEQRYRPIIRDKYNGGRLRVSAAQSSDDDDT